MSSSERQHVRARLLLCSLVSVLPPLSACFVLFSTSKLRISLRLSSLCFIFASGVCRSGLASCTSDETLSERLQRWRPRQYVLAFLSTVLLQSAILLECEVDGAVAAVVSATCTLEQWSPSRFVVTPKVDAARILRTRMIPEVIRAAKLVMVGTWVQWGAFGTAGISATGAAWMTFAVVGARLQFELMDGVMVCHVNSGLDVRSELRWAGPFTWVRRAGLRRSVAHQRFCRSVGTGFLHRHAERNRCYSKRSITPRWC